MKIWCVFSTLLYLCTSVEHNSKEQLRDLFDLFQRNFSILVYTKKHSHFVTHFQHHHVGFSLCLLTTEEYDDRAHTRFIQRKLCFEIQYAIPVEEQIEQDHSVLHLIHLLVHIKIVIEFHYQVFGSSLPIQFNVSHFLLVVSLLFKIFQATSLWLEISHDHFFYIITESSPQASFSIYTLPTEMEAVFILQNNVGKTVPFGKAEVTAIFYDDVLAILTRDLRLLRKQAFVEFAQRELLYKSLVRYQRFRKYSLVYSLFLSSDQDNFLRRLDHDSYLLFGIITTISCLEALGKQQLESISRVSFT